MFDFVPAYQNGGVAPTVVGAMRGLETLLQLLNGDADGWFVPAVSIKDQPRFQWRGLLIDVARHWQPLEVINPIRFAAPLAPAVAAESEVEGGLIDLSPLPRALRLLDQSSDALVIEGVGGLLVPLDPRRPEVTVLDLIAALRYPVVIVCRATLGTLNHTAMTVRLLRKAGCRIAGLVLNGYEPDVA